MLRTGVIAAAAVLALGTASIGTASAQHRMGGHGRSAGTMHGANVGARTHAGANFSHSRVAGMRHRGEHWRGREGRRFARHHRGFGWGGTDVDVDVDVGSPGYAYGWGDYGYAATIAPGYGYASSCPCAGYGYAAAPVGIGVGFGPGWGWHRGWHRW
jgi:hypothetical protein